jgi:hypothetical protein
LVLPEYLPEGSRFELSAKIGGETVARFFDPESIDFRIDGIEAPPEILDKLDSLFRAQSPGSSLRALVLAFICRAPNLTNSSIAALALHFSAVLGHSAALRLP